MRFPRVLKVGKNDRYEMQVDADWLGAETITSCTVAAASGVVTIGATSITGNSVFFMVTGVSVGNTEISFNLATSGGRTDCKHGRIYTEDC